MKLTSPAFSDGGRIPQVYTGRRAGGADQSIPFEWTDVPEGTRSFLLAIVDHAPVAREWVHWVVVDMPPDARSLPAGASRSSGLPWGSHELFNTGGGPGYTGPVPPAGTGDHPYEATVYALSVPRVDTLPRQPTAEDVAAAVARITLDSASLTGTYSQ